MDGKPILPSVTSGPVEPKIHRVHADADRLLKQLRSDRTDSEQRLDAAGKVDAMKIVTGHSSMDHAIDQTCRIIDRIVGEYTQDIAGNGSESRPAIQRNAQRS